MEYAPKELERGNLEEYKVKYKGPYAIHYSVCLYSEDHERESPQDQAQCSTIEGKKEVLGNIIVIVCCT